MRFFLFFFLFFSISQIPVGAQSITLRVLGKVTYTNYAESNGMIISFDKSDYQNKKKLIDSIKKIGVNSSLIHIDKASLSTIKRKRFKIEESDLDLFYELISLCNEQNIRIEKIYYKMPIHKFENEDKNAILAFKNAKTQAKIIAHNLNYKIARVLNIDDDTTESNSIYDLIDKDTERGKILIRLLLLLGGGNNIFQTESDKPERLGGYNLWVTFELKPM